MKSMKQWSLVMTAIFAAGSVMAQNTFGEAVGTFLNADGKEAPLNAHVFTMRSEEKFISEVDPIDGRFRISAIPAGTYTFYGVVDKDTTLGYLREITPDGMVRLDLKMQSTTIIPEVEVYAKIKVLPHGTGPDFKLSRADLKHNPGKFNTKDMLATMTSDIKKTDDGELVFRGARKGDVITMLDGIKMTEIQNVPSASLGYIMVYTGAIPAKYGDTLGGVVVMETLSYFDLLRQRTSEESLK
jgi:hypothetical protein